MQNLTTIFVNRSCWGDVSGEDSEISYIQNRIIKNQTVFIQVINGPNYSIDLKRLVNVELGTRLSFCRFNSTGTNIIIKGIEINMNQTASLRLDKFGSLIEVIYNSGKVWNVVGGQGYTIL